MIADRLVRRALVAAALLCALAPVPARAQDEVRIDLSTDQTKRVSVQLEALAAAGDRGPSSAAAQTADVVLAADLSGSGVFDVALGWENGGVPPPASRRSSAARSRSRATRLP